MKTMIRIVSVLTIALMICVAIPIIPSSDSDADSLPYVSDVAWDGNSVKWGAFEGASKYRVLLRGDHNNETPIHNMSTIDNSDVTDTSITYDYLLPGMTYIVEVAALDTNENLLSEWTCTGKYTVSGTIGTVNNIKWSETGNVLTWDQVSGANGYDICVLKEGIQVGSWGYTTNSSIDITTWVDGNSGGNGNYTVKVNAFKHDTGNWLAMGESSQKYLEGKTKVTIGDVSILGTTNVEIASQTVTVEIADDTFQSSLSGSWITNLPAGLSQSVTRESDTEATITITGTPTAASDASISITIPGGMMTRGVDIEVPINTDAKYEIIDDILITSVSVTGILEPYVGGAPMTYLYGVGYPSDSGYDVETIDWFCDTDGQWIIEEAFEEEKSYTMYVYLTLEEGYGFASTASITINGKTAVFEEPIPDTYRGALKFDSEDVGLAQELTFTDSSEFDIPEGDQGAPYTTSRPVLSAVSGGTAPYEISFNPGIAGLFISEGFIKYSRAFVDEERTVEVIVTDSSTPANSKTISIKIGAVFAELVFQDDVGFDIPEGYANDPISSIDVSSAVSGGKAPYTFSKVSGPAWISVSADGTISGTRPAAVEAASELVVKVTDSASNEKSITIAVGATVVLTKEDTPSAATFTATGHDTGKLTDVASGMVYRIDTGEEIPITGTSVELEDLEACTIYIIKKATGPTKLDSDPKVISVTVGATPAATFTATGDKTGILSDVSSGMAYRFGTGEWVQITETTVDLTDLVPTTISIVLRASGTVLQSAPQAIEVTKANVPSGVTAEKCTASTNDDGKLKGVTTSMEYRLSTGDSWTAGTGSDLTVPAGTYHVRVKVSGTALASDYVSVIVNKYDAVPLTGTVSINGNAVFGGVLTVQLNDSNNTGTLSYRWVREGGTIVGTSDEYTVVKEDIGKTITVYLVSSKQTGELNKSTGTVSKAPRSDVPTGLDVVNTAHGQSEGRITGVNDSMEYRLSTANSWTPITGTEVTGLAVGTYHVRFAMSDTHLASSQHATVTISESTYTVSFDLNGHGDDISAIDNVEYGSKVDRPANPSETGYTFGGWFKETGCETAWNFDTDVVTSDVTLYAKWTLNEYTITFDSAGGSDVTSITQNYGTTITAPADPTKTGYTFNGWSPAIPATMPAENITCVAQWVAIDYVVTFDPNGGTVDPTTKTVNYGVEYGELPTPTKAGNNFIGWFTASDDSGVKINADTVVLSTENHTLYAKWIPISDDDDEGGGGVNIGLIIGGVVAVIAAAGVGVFLFMRRRP